MDLRVVVDVLARRKWIVLAAAGLGVILGVLAVARPTSGPPFLAYRDSPVFQSTSTLAVQQVGFPAGAVVPSYTRESPDTSPVELGDPNRLATLTLLYAQLATSDEVVRPVLGSPPAPGESTDVQAVPAPPYQSPGTLPFLTVTATALSADRAHELARLQGTSFIGYLRSQQDAAEIPVNRRAVVSVLREPSPGVLVAGRTLTMGIVAFVAVLGIGIAVAFAIENVQRGAARAGSDGVRSVPAVRPPAAATTKRPSEVRSVGAEPGSAPSLRGVAASDEQRRVRHSRIT